MVRAQVTSVRQRRLSSLQQARGTIVYKPKQEVQSARQLAELNAKSRKSLQTSQFALPSKRSKSGGKGGYPIPDRAHAQNALARVSQFGTPAEKAAVKAAVARKFPGMGKAKKAAPKKGGK